MVSFFGWPQCFNSVKIFIVVSSFLNIVNRFRGQNSSLPKSFNNLGSLSLFFGGWMLLLNRNTPAEGMTEELDKVVNHSVTHYSDVGRMAITYKYGGFYLDLDIIVTRNMRDLSNFIVIERGRKKWDYGLFPRLRCHPEVTSDQTKSNAHGVFPDQNYRVWDLVRAHNSMIRGQFGLGMVWSEVTSVWGWYDQRSLRSGDGMIRGHFGLGMVWSEVTSVWGWYDQRSLRSGDGMIRGYFGLGMVWSEVTSVWGWYDQRSLRSGDGMIRGHFVLGMVWSEGTSVWGW